MQQFVIVEQLEGHATTQLDHGFEAILKFENAARYQVKVHGCRSAPCKPRAWIDVKIWSTISYGPQVLDARSRKFQDPQYIRTDTAICPKVFDRSRVCQLALQSRISQNSVPSPNLVPTKVISQHRNVTEGVVDEAPTENPSQKDSEGFEMNTLEIRKLFRYPRKTQVLQGSTAYYAVHR